MKLRNFAVVFMLVMFIAGCGGPKPDVSIFIMANSGILSGEKLQASLQEKIGQAPTVGVTVAPMFSLEKLVVEVAAGGHGVIIVPKEQFETYGKQGGFVSLDDTFNPDDYPEAVLEAEINENNKIRKEKHLYGLPMHKMKWFKDAGYEGDELFAFIPQNADDIAKAKQVLKTIADMGMADGK